MDTLFLATLLTELLAFYFLPLIPHPHTPKDDFSVYHSSARITVECDFGKISMIWGIFWSRLNGTLDHSVLVIHEALQLYIFLVQYREDYNCQSESLED